VGLNVYQPEYARASESPSGYAVATRPTSFPQMASPWLFVGPEGMYWAVRTTTELWQPRAIFITENGCSSEDSPQRDGRIEDTDRVMFLRNYLTHLRRAAVEGYPVRGYFLWSLLDNFEWADGYGKRFGIYHVDFATQKRTRKLSAEWYRQVILNNSVQ
jgi:beta-glucosidase